MTTQQANLWGDEKRTAAEDIRTPHDDYRIVTLRWHYATRYAGQYVTGWHTLPRSQTMLHCWGYDRVGVCVSKTSYRVDGTMRLPPYAPRWTRNLITNDNQNERHTS